MLLWSILSVSLINGTNYYVSTSGSDSNDGLSLSTPWLTWQKAIDESPQPGDTIFIRSGTYTVAASKFSGVWVHTNSGTSSGRIVMMKHPGDPSRPILDCQNLTQTNNNLVTGIRFWQSDYWHLKDLVIQNVPHAGSGTRGRGIFVENSTHHIYENIEILGCAGSGFYMSDQSNSNTSHANNTLIINCDSHDNNDSQYGGEHADGFGYGESCGSGVRFVNCRAWDNADDGFDLFGTEEAVTIENCWAIRNGYGRNGNGTGFKLGRNDDGPMHTLLNGLTVENRRRGVDINWATEDFQKWYNISSYNHPEVEFITRYDIPPSHFNPTPKNTSNRPDSRVLLHNNLSINSSFNANNRFDGPVTEQSNSWNQTQLNISLDDFISVNSFELTNSRQVNGSLPDISFLKLKYPSSLIDQGEDIGLAFTGIKPDLGCFEYHVPENLTVIVKPKVNSNGNVEIPALLVGKYEAKESSYSGFPTRNVTWFDAIYYCNLLSEKEGFEPYYTLGTITKPDANITNISTVTRNVDANGYRLPTTAEWEYFYGKSSTSDYYWESSEDQNDYCWNVSNSGSTLHPVGEKLPNKFGLYDMAGNVTEWTDTEDQSGNVYVMNGSVVDPIEEHTYNNYWGPRAKDSQSEYRGFRVVRNAPIDMTPINMLLLD